MNKHLSRAGKKPALPSCICIILRGMRFLISLSARKTHGRTTKTTPVDAFQQCVGRRCALNREEAPVS